MKVSPSTRFLHIEGDDYAMAFLTTYGLFQFSVDCLTVTNTEFAMKLLNSIVDILSKSSRHVIRLILDFWLSTCPEEIIATLLQNGWQSDGEGRLIFYVYPATSGDVDEV